MALVYFISERGQQFPIKLLLLKGWKLFSDVEHPNLSGRERDFCSARQAYAHARKKLQEEETSLIPKKSLRGELLGEAH